MYAHHMQGHLRPKCLEAQRYRAGRCRRGVQVTCRCTAVPLLGCRDGWSELLVSGRLCSWLRGLGCLRS